MLLCEGELPAAQGLEEKRRVKWELRGCWTLFGNGENHALQLGGCPKDDNGDSGGRDPLGGDVRSAEDWAGPVPGRAGETKLCI
ncbi:Adp-Ribosylation Factor-Like Protein 11 [Manis pentadactyla]|nr:Adp-Ribosylation Factor-Like Protein 11 [Manis pentadactyla]